MSITARKKADGTTVYDVREYVGFTIDGARDRRSVTCKTKREAEVEQAKLVAMRDAKRNRSGRITFGDYVTYHWWPAKQNLANSTLDGYDRDLRLRLLPAFGNVDIRDIDRVRIQRMVDTCPTHKVARNALDTLRTVLNEAIGDRLIDANPTRASYNMPPKSKRKPGWGGAVITRFDRMGPILAALRAFSEANGTEGPACEKNALCGLLMGMRPGERLGLDWSDFDWDRSAVRVAHSFTEATARNGGNQYKDTKTDVSMRVLPVPGYAVDRLQLLRGDDDGEFILGAGGGRCSPHTMYHRWRHFLRWCAAEGLDIPQVSLESMRHSFATSYLHAGGNVEDLSRILGHSDINTTFRRYVRPSIDDLAAGIDATVNAAIGYR